MDAVSLGTHVEVLANTRDACQTNGLLRANNKRSKCDVTVRGILCDGKCFAEPLIPPCCQEKVSETTKGDPVLNEQCQKATNVMVHDHQEQQHDAPRDEPLSAPGKFHDIPLHEAISENTPVNAMRKEAERVL